MSSGGDRSHGNGYRAAAQHESFDPDDIQCGFFCWQPRWMQTMANKFTYLLVYCSCGLIQGMWYTYFVSILSTVEKTFKFPSSVTGIILAGNDLAQIFFAVFISYYGGRGNRPRWVGGGMLMNALGCLLSALPHFVWGPDRQDVAAALRASRSATNHTSTADLASIEASLCHVITNSSLQLDELVDCDQEVVSLVPVILLFISQFVSGIGATSYYTLGMTYLDDSVDKEHSPVMFAISAGLRVMGPMLGFILGSFSLSKFVIPSLKPNISLKDPRWIGAWWLGFFVLAVLLVIASTLMCLFPKVLPERRRKQEETQLTNEVPLSTMMGSKEDLQAGLRPVVKTPKVSGLVTTLKRLLRNTLLVVMLSNVVFAVIGFIGYFTFLPKYQQAAFKKSASTASLFSGLSGVLVTLVGYIISGVVMKVFKPRALYVTGYSALVSGVQTACMFALMTIRCYEPDMYGSLQHDGQFILQADCNVDCGCETFRSLNPVCASDGLANFFSPCFAGCHSFSDVNGSTTFHNCSCIGQQGGGSVATGNIDDSSLLNMAGGATQGFCDTPCDGFMLYIIILAVMKFIGSTNRTGGMLVFFRSVPDEDKSLAMGMSTALLSIFCFIPAPIIFGAIVDSACKIWDEKPCGGQGNCLIYDTDKLRIYLHTATIIAFGISFLLDLVIVYLARGLDLYGEAEKVERERRQPAADT